MKKDEILAAARARFTEIRDVFEEGLTLRAMLDASGALELTEPFVFSTDPLSAGQSARILLEFAVPVRLREIHVDSEIAEFFSVTDFKIGRLNYLPSDGISAPAREFIAKAIHSIVVVPGMTGYIEVENTSKQRAPFRVTFQAVDLTMVPPNNR